MASPSGLLSEDQFTCPICLDVFTEPVSIPCGHNFCQACLGRHWEDSRLRQCPLCNHKFGKALKLRVNTGFREVVESYPKLSEAPTAEGAQVQPGEVPCDLCPERRYKATKSCLACLASYCDSHQEPHRRVAALKRHQLSDPVPNLKSALCKKHGSILELFCREDGVCICALCAEHETHDTVPLEEEYEDAMSQLEQEKVEINHLIQEREKKVQELDGDMENRRRLSNQAKMSNAKVLAALMESLRISMGRLTTELDEKQKVEERQAEVLAKELKKEITALQTRMGTLENISNAEGPLQLVQGFLRHSHSPFPRLKDWSDVGVSGQHCVKEVTEAVKNLEATLTRETDRARGRFGANCNKIFCEEMVRQGQTWIRELPDLDPRPEGGRLLALRQLYEKDMTFDLSSARGLLMFSENFKEVQASEFLKELFFGTESYSYVLGKTGLSAGRFYYQVQVRRKTGWDLGVARESVRGQQTITPKPRDGVWIIRLREGRYWAMNSVPRRLSAKTPEHVGVFVDYCQGLVSFYDVGDATLIYSFTRCKFKEKIFPFFSPGPRQGLKNSAPLVLSSKTKAKTRSSLDDPNSFQSLVFYLVLMFFSLLLGSQSELSSKT